MNVKTQTLLWIAQRASAAVLALCVVVHLATMIYAVRGGLTAAEILGRTRGNAAWFAFYSLFVLAVVDPRADRAAGRAQRMAALARRGRATRAVLHLRYSSLLAGMRAVLAVFA